ncbi:MAG: hypothetical protein CMK64_11590 [Pseudoalteromonas sp.]|nr:hypothetical protein [Pseudoalteromonas sp.]
MNCFVIMPFSNPYNDYYTKIIKPTIEEQGFKVQRADEIFSNGSIIEDVYSKIIDADLIIADVSGKNPNVNYELGVAHALKKRVIIISRNLDDIPFDYKHIRTIIYNHENYDWVEKLKTSLVETILPTMLSDYSGIKIESLDNFYKNFSPEGMHGFKRVFKSRQEMNLRLDELWRKESNQLDIIAFGLKSFRDSQHESIVEKIQKGLKLRILTIDPKSLFLKQREKDESLIEGSIAKTIEDLSKWSKSINNSMCNDSVTLKFYNTLPLDFYWRQDSSIFIGPYLYGIGSQQTVSYELDLNSQVGAFYQNYYERIFNNKEFCCEQN